MTWLVGYVDTVEMFDAERCPDPVPAGYPACLVYAGGTAAAHAWDEAERARVAHLHNLPTWVPNPAVDDPTAAAEAFVVWLIDNAYTPVVDGTDEHQAVLWDMETAGHADARWLDKACDHLAAAGYWNLVYGSTSTLFGLPERDGYVVADPTGAPHMYLHPAARATQHTWNVHVAGGTIDESAAAKDLLRQLRQPAR